MASDRGWTVPALTSVLGGLALVVPTVLALRIVDQPPLARSTVVRFEPTVVVQVSAARASTLAGWPPTLLFALRLGALVAESALDSST